MNKHDFILSILNIQKEIAALQSELINKYSLVDLLQVVTSRVTAMPVSWTQNISYYILKKNAHLQDMRRIIYKGYLQCAWANALHIKVTKSIQFQNLLKFSSPLTGQVYQTVKSSVSSLSL